MNNNGHISFGSAYSNFIPQRFPIHTPLIAPYWADADTRPENGGTVWYRESTRQEDRDRAQRDVRALCRNARLVPRLVFIATWDHVGYWPEQTDRVLIIAIGRHFAMYH